MGKQDEPVLKITVVEMSDAEFMQKTAEEAVALVNKEGSMVTLQWGPGEFFVHPGQTVEGLLRLMKMAIGEIGPGQ